MKINFLFFVLILILASCKKQSELSKEFNCNSIELTNLKSYLDAAKGISPTSKK